MWKITASFTLLSILSYILYLKNKKIFFIAYIAVRRLYYNTINYDYKKGLIKKNDSYSNETNEKVLEDTSSSSEEEEMPPSPIKRD